VIPYVSNQDGGAVLNAEGGDKGELNRWLVGAWLSTLILARQSGLKVGFPREYSDWEKIPMLLLPAPITSTSDNLVHIHTSFWGKAKDYVQQGGVIYASLCGDVAIPDMDELFGARLADHAPAENVTLKVIHPFGELQPGDAFIYQIDISNPKNWAATLDIRAGQVIAVDQESRPALIANQFGKGKTLLCAYPIESYLAQKPAAFEGDENFYCIYQALRHWAGVHSLFTTDQPAVEVSTLAGPNRGYAIFANHKSLKCEVNISSQLKLARIRQVTPSGLQELKLNRQNWMILLDGFSGAVIEWFL
jgi:beta-galactosidase